MRCTSEAEISLLASSELLPRKSEPIAYLLCLCYLGVVRREERQPEQSGSVPLLHNFARIADGVSDLFQE